MDIDVRNIVSSSFELWEGTVGVFKDAPLNEEDYSRPKGVLQGFSSIPRRAQKENTSWHGKKVSDSMTGMWDDSGLFDMLEKRLTETNDRDLIEMFLQGYSDGDNYSPRRAETTLMSFTKQEYARLAMTEEVGEERAKEKGFENAGIGTGQTFMGIEAKFSIEGQADDDVLNYVLSSARIGK
jgi:hypothetical protein